MKANYFEAVTYGSEVYCVGCLPDGVDVDDEEVHPILASDEWDYAPSCDACGEVHDYVSLSEEEEDEEEEEEECTPEDGDYTTEDHRKFYQYGKLVLEVEEDEDYKAAVSAHMEREKFWPNVWFISDHGNPHLLSLNESE